MKEILSTKAGADSLKAILVEGQILEANARQRASVQGSGRGNKLKVQTNHHSWTDVWIRTNHGNEFEAQLQASDPSVRAGHQVSLLFLQKNAGPMALFGVENQTVGRFAFRNFEHVKKQAGFKKYEGLNGLLGLLAVFGGGLAGLYLGTTNESWLLGLGVPALSVGVACWISYSLDKIQGVHAFQKLGRDIIGRARLHKGFSVIADS